MAKLKHVVAMSLRKDFSPEEKQAHLRRIKSDVENLKGVVPVIKDITVHIDLLPSSTADFVIDSSFADEAALNEYQVHPVHVKVAEFISSVRSDRTCVDYFEA